MTRFPHISIPWSPLSTGRRVGLGLALAAFSLTLIDCNGHAPKGQVVAVVNGQEVTGQDLTAEARGSGQQAAGSAPVLLQRVIARILLAQSAHARNLDRYPGYPADLARIQQDFLAQKALQTVVKAPGKPTASDEERFIAAHPYMFKARTRLQVDQIRFQSGDDMKSLSGADSLTSVLARLKSLNIPFDRATRTLDTAQLPPALAQKFAGLSLGQLFFIRDRDVVIGMVIENRQAVTLPSEQEDALAAQLMTRLATQGQIETAVRSLRAKAKITYQSGYAPPAPGVVSQPDAKPAAPKG